MPHGDPEACSERGREDRRDPAPEHAPTIELLLPRLSKGLPDEEEQGERRQEKPSDTKDTERETNATVTTDCIPLIGKEVGDEIENESEWPEEKTPHTSHGTSK